jgi:hypothetical protein
VSTVSDIRSRLNSALDTIQQRLVEQLAENEVESQKVLTAINDNSVTVVSIFESAIAPDALERLELLIGNVDRLFYSDYR